MTNIEDVFSHIDAQEIAQICQDLIRIDTTNPPGNERTAAEYLRDSLRRFGFEDKWVDHDPQRASLIARLPGKGEEAPLVFNGHLDVVPVGKNDWHHPPFAGVIEKGKVWGRGSADMKGGLASMAIAAKAIAKARIPLRGDLILTATAGEEVNMLGAQSIAALPEAKNWQAIVISEPTSNKLGLAERGVLWVELTTYGKTAHGSTPALGKNAITMMVQLLNELEELEIPFQPHPVLGNFTRSVNMIQGGIQVNVVPDQCTVKVDMRTLPGQDHASILNQLSDFLAAREKSIPDFKASLHVIHELPAAETSHQNPVVQSFERAFQTVAAESVPYMPLPYATEAAVFVPLLNVPTLVFGPGDPALAHQPNEFIEISAMEKAAKVYAAYALELLG